MSGDRQTRFVALEGLDGSGTTTQARLLADALQGRDLRVRVTAEPSDGPVGLLCRAHVQQSLTLPPASAALAFSADRADHLHRVIRPALASGEWVVCDRYLLSTLAYQGAEGVDREWVLDISRAFDVPHLTVFLDVGQEVRARRMAGRSALDRYESPAGQERLRDSYLASIELLRDRGHRILVLDGEQPPRLVLERVLEGLDT